MSLTAVSKIVSFPASEGQKREAALERDVEDLVDAFCELHEVECMTGRTGFSARVRLSIMNILSAADKAARVKEARK